MKATRIVLASFIFLFLAACGNNSPVATNPPTTNPPTTNPPTTNPPTTNPPTTNPPTTNPPTTNPPTTNPPTTNPPTTNPPVEDGTISGTLTAPAGGAVEGTVVFTCSDEACTNSAEVIVTPDGAYTLANLQTVAYTIYAFKDVDGDQTLNNGDYIGRYSQDGQNLTPVTPPASGIDITMVVYSDGGTPPDTGGDKPTPTDGGSISGSLSMGPKSNVLGDTVIIACSLVDPTDVNSGCDESLSVRVELTDIGPATPVPYSVNNVAAGQYLIFAVADSDGDGQFDGDYDQLGVYPVLSAAELVSPPATGIDIPMSYNTNLASNNSQKKLESLKSLSRGRFLTPHLKKALRNLDLH